MSYISEFLVNSFIKYTSISSQSDDRINSLPSSPGQMKLAKILKQDLENFGIHDISLDEHAILIAKITATLPNAPAISFMSHLDTVDIGVEPDIHAQILPFTGEDLILNNEKNIIFKTVDYPDIQAYKGEKIIFSDGTSVLGADDKAGVTAMMGLAKHLTSEKIEHGDVYLVFVPDEEIGLRGAYTLDLNKIPVNYSYTVDGGRIGELSYETFNAAGVIIKIQGVSIHPGSAKDILVNPILVAMDLIGQFDRLDTPEHSEGKEGFFWIHDMIANPSEANIKIIIRDFDLPKFEERKQKVVSIIEQTQKRHPRAMITFDMEDSYANIANNLSDDRSCVDLAISAYEKSHVTVIDCPIRGGTDGAVLSSKGLITPNIFTGGHNCHSIFEYLPVNSLVKSFEVLTKIVELAAKKDK
ncbi:MAG: peptidase T [Brevinema sp.]